MRSRHRRQLESAVYRYGRLATLWTVLTAPIARPGPPGYWKGAPLRMRWRLL